MEDIRVLVMTNFTYTYGSKVGYRLCGESMYFNPSSSEQLAELEFILDSSYMKKGWLYVEEDIKTDFQNKRGVFGTKVSISQEVSSPVINIEPTEPEVIQVEPTIEEVPVIEEPVVELTKSLEERKAELSDMLAADIRKLAETLSIEYTNKTKTIEAILQVEYPN